MQHLTPQQSDILADAGITGEEISVLMRLNLVDEAVRKLNHVTVIHKQLNRPLNLFLAARARMLDQISTIEKYLAEYAQITGVNVAFDPTEPDAFLSIKHTLSAPAMPAPRRSSVWMRFLHNERIKGVSFVFSYGAYNLLHRPAAVVVVRDGNTLVIAPFHQGLRVARNMHVYIPISLCNNFGIDNTVSGERRSVEFANARLYMPL